MEHDTEKKVIELKERLARGEYAVDPPAVADAILRRSRDLAPPRVNCRREARGGARLFEMRELPPQSLCSYPESPPEASVKVTPGFPVLTWPIQVIGRFRLTAASCASMVARALGGAQTQSS